MILRARELHSLVTQLFLNFSGQLQRQLFCENSPSVEMRCNHESVIDIYHILFAGHRTELTQPCDANRWVELILQTDSGCKRTAKTNTDEPDIGDEVYRRWANDLSAERKPKLLCF